MNVLFATRNELIGLVIASGAILLTGLVLRNPLAPKILRTEFAAHCAALVLVAILLVATSYATQGFVAAGLTHVEAAVAVVTTLAASILLFWVAFRIGDRLKRADAGHSPFARLQADRDPDQAPNTLPPPSSR